MENRFHVAMVLPSDPLAMITRMIARTMSSTMVRMIGLRNDVGMTKSLLA
ncbi:MAG: hypothetical protein PHR90_08565 [Sphaerochaetaceae bacterium]|nr:hypothetical protein [Sphaerochaetaceae bacterium]